ncbi:MAG: TorF family putative porin [Sphingomicrobium sp.]
MIKNSLYALALAASAYAAPAAAQDAAAAPEAPASAFTLNGGATLVSDYRFRGISQTNRKPAVQGSLTVGHSSGFYGTIWGSSIDEYVAAGSDQEIDLVAGYKKTFGTTTVDVGATYYLYPGACCGADTNFIEPYVAVSQAFGIVTAKALLAYAPKQKGLSIGSGSEDNVYLAGDLSTTIPNSTFGLAAHLGHSFGPSYLTIGKGYTDWSLGGTYAWKNLAFGLSYVDTNKSLTGPTGKNLAGSGVVASIGVAF